MLSRRRANPHKRTIPALLLILAGAVVQEAHAAPMCQGDLTGRTLTVDTATLAAFGRVQGGEPLPLRAGEYVLTIDDGPHRPTTQRLLAILRENCAPATFFLIGRRAAALPDLVRAIAAEGHAIGGHSMSHGDFSLLSREEMGREIRSGAEAVETALGGKPLSSPAPRLFRTPGTGNPNAINRQDLAAAARDLGATIAGYDISAQDWRGWPPDNSLDTVRRSFRQRDGDRGVILIHDGQENTVAFLPMLLAELRARGAKLVTLTFK